jgi:hypothetical protein
MLEAIRNLGRKGNKCTKEKWEGLYKPFNSCQKRKTLESKLPSMFKD